MYIIRSYETSRGDKSVYNFIEYIEPKAQRKIIKWIDRLGNFGVQKLIKDEKCKKIKSHKDVKNLYELTINYSGIFYRILFCIIKNDYWLLHAFKKKSNETPKKELNLAICRYKELIKYSKI